MHRARVDSSADSPEATRCSCFSYQLQLLSIGEFWGTGIVPSGHWRISVISIRNSHCASEAAGKTLEVRKRFVRSLATPYSSRSIHLLSIRLRESKRYTVSKSVQRGIVEAASYRWGNRLLSALRPPEMPKPAQHLAGGSRISLLSGPSYRRTSYPSPGPGAGFSARFVNG